MKVRKIVGYYIAGTLAALVGCTPIKPAVDEEYEFCWEALSALFIYQDRLPQDPYQYGTPDKLYESVNDRYTRYYSPEQAVKIYKMLSSTTGGIGIRIDTASTRYYIRDVFKNSPGDRAGLAIGDTLVKAGSAALDGLPRDSLSAHLSGAIGTQLSLQVKRGDSLVTVTVTIGEFLAPTVFIDSLDSTTAYILLTMFSDSTINPDGSAAEFRDALDKTAWAKYTLLDIRHNLGGRVTQCVTITSQFIPKDTPIVRTASRDYDSVVTKNFVTVTGVLKAKDGQKALNRRFAVLVDDSTASASEILVSCLKERRSATVKIIGQKTFGKGCGWSLVPTPKNGIATITSLLQFPIFGTDYNLIGIDPDIPVPDGVDAEQVALSQIHTGALGKVLVNARALARIRDLRADVMPRNRIPMCVIKPGDFPKR